MGENKPLKDLALGLACHGIASIRFDKVTYTYPKAFRIRKNMTVTEEYAEQRRRRIAGPEPSKYPPSPSFRSGT